MLIWGYPRNKPINKNHKIIISSKIIIRNQRTSRLFKPSLKKSCTPIFLNIVFLVKNASGNMKHFSSKWSNVEKNQIYRLLFCIWCCPFCYVKVYPNGFWNFIVSKKSFSRLSLRLSHTPRLYIVYNFQKMFCIVWLGKVLYNMYQSLKMLRTRKPEDIHINLVFWTLYVSDWRLVFYNLIQWWLYLILWIVTDSF